MLNTTQHGAGTGRVVQATAGQGLDALDPAEVIALLGETGYLLFRGFSTDTDRFNAFVRGLSSRIISDPAREFEGEAAQKVDAGLQGVGLHLENGNSPFAPDLTWFFCRRAASAGSQTTVCDGYRVWDELSESARDAFAAQDIVYARNVPERLWRAFATHALNGTKAFDEVTIEDLLTMLSPAERGRTTLRTNIDRSVYYAYQVPGARAQTLFGSRTAWANSIFGPSYNYEQPTITFADGTEITEDLLAECRKVTDAVTEDIVWQDGDVALIDNTRVMHGRREIIDPDRTIFNAQSYLNKELL
jgi:alpha-ketoglutarate-dependent taurine dioxygenase